MLVGEQPGDQEDRKGHPFVGPAGGVLWRCVEEAGIRDDVYTTNAVKHFKHEVRGKRRLHKKPGTAEIEACHPWLTAEIEASARGSWRSAPSPLVRCSATVGIAASGESAGGVRRSVYVTYHPSACSAPTSGRRRSAPPSSRTSGRRGRGHDPKRCRSGAKRLRCVGVTDIPLYSRPDVYQRRWFLLGVLCLSLVMIVMAVSSLNVALPTLQQELETSATTLQWIVDAYALVFAGFLLTAGALGDRFGRKGALLVGLGVFAVGALVSGFAGSAGVVIAGRAVQGLGAALVMPATLSLITAIFPPHERQRAIAIWVGFAGAGGALGPIVSGALLERFWWGSAFLVNIPVVAITALAVALYSPKSRDDAATPLDPRGAVLSLVGLAALLFGIIEGPERGWTSSVVVATFVIAAVFLVGFVQWERRAPAPDAAAVLLRRPPLQRRERRHHDVVLRDVRVLLPVLAVPPVRPRLLAARRRPGHAAVRRHDRRRVAAQRRAGRALRRRTHDRRRVRPRRRRHGGHGPRGRRHAVPRCSWGRWCCWRPAWPSWRHRPPAGS